MPWTLTLRTGPKVRRERFATLPEALDALEARLDELGPSSRRSTVKALTREIEPVRQVAARGEVAGPGRLLPRVRAGADLRGDGSVEAYTGRVGRAVLEQAPGESAYDALRRALGALPTGARRG